MHSNHGAKFDSRCPGSRGHPRGVRWIEAGMGTSPVGGKPPPVGAVREHNHHQVQQV